MFCFILGLTLHTICSTMAWSAKYHVSLSQCWLKLDMYRRHGNAHHGGSITHFIVLDIDHVYDALLTARHYITAVPVIYTGPGGICWISSILLSTLQLMDGCNVMVLQGHA